mmetsp:Transcript_7666/g.28729  ORF Transcript_7666/g.28729 Transcript_7666/m.28729 type:complete len:114 (-) Transcript_7666:663-1004(-)
MIFCEIQFMEQQQEPKFLSGSSRITSHRSFSVHVMLLQKLPGCEDPIQLPVPLFAAPETFAVANVYPTPSSPLPCEVFSSVCFGQLCAASSHLLEANCSQERIYEEISQLVQP